MKACYFHNGHGDVTALLQADGTVLNTYSYDIWGNPVVSEEKVENLFSYSGEYWDAVTGLQYLRTRWYDPDLGRFIQKDTFEGFMNRPSSLNPYVYVENNPTTYVDPTGEATQYCALNCFVAGTLVETDHGSKPIEEIQVGDKVLAQDEETGKLAYQPVEETFQRETSETYHIQVGDTEIVTTAEHPFWVIGKGWVESRNLNVGDTLVDNEKSREPESQRWRYPG
ncbi:RHS repeat-associated core domain-containing protein [Paenibacillus sp. JX-17]|uniref:RHS repeat-associated core domain-containing protein n=1 Tax=Paenibacillus lacisoli TaxID=3064525 RepID=A0ABT9CIS5_9BACL|nr:RHS repeat-associated core domain-containing protein [Paenibacillus sp. JX-17]MDO7908785.1 RHS repeat-associated core domain-containing protein [Paenibacillus sp. JX-17]